MTIQPRGQAMGVAHFSPGELLYTRRYLEGADLKGLGGRAAEEIVFGHDAVTSGAKATCSTTRRRPQDGVQAGDGAGHRAGGFDDRRDGEP